MANYLRKTMQETIQNLRRNGWSLRRIARELGINRRTVRKYGTGVSPVEKQSGISSKCTTMGQVTTGGLFCKEAPKCTIAEEVTAGDMARSEGTRQGSVQSLLSPPESYPEGDCFTVAAGEVSLPIQNAPGYLSSKCTIGEEVTAGKPIHEEVSKCTTFGQVTAGNGSRSLCERYGHLIEQWQEENLSAQRIYQDLKVETDYEGSYESVKRYARKLRERNELPFRRMEVEFGEEAQVDYGTGAWVVDSNGKKHKTHVLRVVLSASRKGYSEASYHQDTESFIRGIENAFRTFGGVPKTVVIDNLRAGVLHADLYEPELNPKLRDFACHYGCCILPSRVRTPRHKGKVEGAVKYVQNNALKGRKFRSLCDQNEFLKKWEQQTADQRIHGTNRQQVRRMFELEKQHLQTLPPMLFEVFSESKRKVHRDGHIEVARSYYSVPAEYVRREVWVRYNARTVTVFDLHMNQIAFHSRVEEGRFSTQNTHIPPEKISNPERGNVWMLKHADRIGNDTGEWARMMLKNRGIPGVRVLNGLLQISSKHSCSAMNAACRKARESGAFHLHELKHIIESQTVCEQQSFPFMKEHPLIRPVTEYENITQSKEAFYA
jgi:transposase